MKYLPFYYRWMETGRMDGDGLCRFFPCDEYLELFKPGKRYGGNLWYWGSGFDRYTPEHEANKLYTFTEMRQTIVLFMACLNGEL